MAVNHNADQIYGITATLLNGEPLRLSYFKGKVLLIVNTASKCGFTPQYAGLEQLYRRYSARGFEVLGFPCNQFGKQEPGTAGQIGEFCEKNYGVTFPIFVRIDVNGPGTDPLFRLLKAARPGFLGFKRINWNFTKFLVDRSGNVVSRHAPTVDPLTLAPEIETLLAAR
jgi:glutathione peroxidase